MTGYTWSFGAGGEEMYLIKTDVNGNHQWSKTYGGIFGDGALAVKQTSDGGYIMTGYTANSGAGQEDVYLIKTDANGDTLWTRTYGEWRIDFGTAVEQTSDGGYIIAGFTENFDMLWYDNMYVIKIDSAGDIIWDRTFGEVGTPELAYAVKQTPDGGYIVAGCSWSYGAGSYDVYLVKLDLNGNMLWNRTFGGAGIDVGYEVELTSDGGFIVAGFTNSFGAGGYDVYLIKTDINGDTLWTKTYGGAGNEGYVDVLNSYRDNIGLKQTNDGGFIVVGYTESFGAGSTDIYLIKPDSLGNSECDELYCNQNNPPTIVSGGFRFVDPLTIVGYTDTTRIKKSSPLTIVTSPLTIVDSLFCPPAL